MAVLDADVKRRALAARDTLARLGTVRAVYVFGSNVDGSADAWSDIDVAAFMEDIDDWGIHRRARAMTQVQREVGLEVEAHLFPDAVRRHPQRGSFSEYVLKHGVRVDEPQG
jgi:predicted nucleotidyltransferase